jgi:hypothetical protein
MLVEPGLSTHELTKLKKTGIFVRFTFGLSEVLGLFKPDICCPNLHSSFLQVFSQKPGFLEVFGGFREINQIAVATHTCYQTFAIPNVEIL